MVRLYMRVWSGIIDSRKAEKGRYRWQTGLNGVFTLSVSGPPEPGLEKMGCMI